MPVTLQDIQNAKQAIQNATIRTPTVKAARLSLHHGIELYLKLENLQYTNSFKARGALNKLLTLNEEQRKNGVIACSAGNHAQGVAYHAQNLDIPAIIVMPKGTPFNKVQKTEDFGAKVILFGKDFDESVSEMERIATARNLTIIHPFDDKAIIAGQGTLGLEMLEDEPDLDTIVIPIGGGGLITGVATAAKGLNPNIEIVGAQATLYNPAHAAFNGEKIAPVGGATLAEGIAVKEPAPKNIEAIKTLVDKTFTASEQEIEHAIFEFLSAEKLVAEGASGAGLAVIINNIEYFKGKKVGLIVSGGNIDSRLLSTLILRGMVRDGRITRLKFEITDTPGQLSDISRIIGEEGANIIEVIHQRMMQSVSLKQAELDVVIEAKDKAHVKQILKQLQNSGFKVKTENEV